MTKKSGSKKRLKILISNDDSVHAPGIYALAKELSKVGDVWVVAPMDEKSTTGHSLTIHKPLRLTQMKHLGPRFFGVNGSPADCVYIGIREVLKCDPDLVISGINRGANMGQDVYYSGTVSAAREAAILGLKALAVSLDVKFGRPVDEEKLHYQSAAVWASTIAKKMLDWDVPKYTLLNLNVPDLELKKIKGLRITRQGFRFYSGSVIKRVDHRGKNYFWVGGQYKGFNNEAGTDCHTVANGYASITPLKLDSTDQSCVDWLSQKVSK